MFEHASTRATAENTFYYSDSMNRGNRENANQRAAQGPTTALAQLSASLIHDLRNPLTAISASAELLIGEDFNCTQSKRLAMNIYRASQRLEHLFQDLVDISRGNQEVFASCRLLDVILRAVEQLRPAAESQDAGIKIAAASWIAVSVRSKSMERVFVNLLTNALESMPAGGQIAITAQIVTCDVVVTIDDTGRGVPEELRPKLFKPFVSGDKKNGIGLGLVLSRQTVLDHGGDLWLGDKAGPGARFCLRLPLE